MIRYLVPLLLLSSGITAAPVPKDKDKAQPPDEERILGEWEIVQAEHNGRPFFLAYWTFEKGLVEKSLVMYSRGIKDVDRGSEWKIEIDPNANPKTINIGDYCGIYEFAGDTLKIAFKTGPTRPSELSSKNDTYLNILKRIKK